MKGTIFEMLLAHVIINVLYMYVFIGICLTSEFQDILIPSQYLNEAFYVYVIFYKAFNTFESNEWLHKHQLISLSKQGKTN